MSSFLILAVVLESASEWLACTPVVAQATCPTTTPSASCSSCCTSTWRQRRTTKVRLLQGVSAPLSVGSTYGVSNRVWCLPYASTAAAEEAGEEQEAPQEPEEGQSGGEGEVS